MDWLLGTLVVMGLFLLRLGLPLAVTMAAVYWLHRLDARWHSQA
jgi:hypothetical protein